MESNSANKENISKGVVNMYCGYTLSKRKLVVINSIFFHKALQHHIF